MLVSPEKQVDVGQQGLHVGDERIVVVLTVQRVIRGDELPVGHEQSFAGEVGQLVLVPL